MIKKHKDKITNILILLSNIIGIIILIYVFVFADKTQPDKISYNEFETLVKENKVDLIEYNANNEWMKVYLYNDETKNLSNEERLEYDKYTNKDIKLVQYPKYDNFRKDMLKHNINLKVAKQQNSFIESIMSYTTLIFPLVMIIFFISFMKKQMPETINKKNMFEESNVKFTDIIGQDEILDDVKFIAELIKNPDKGKEIGATVPKGILLCGEPGCGKTLIAKAIAGETDIPFIYQNASSFIDRFVGMGAKHVRDVFKAAKDNSPCIIFIDEIDAIGADRDSNTNNSENTQTINALLQEMDGFKDREGIFVIAATNRPNNLDKALTRAGRFDRQIIVSPPRDWTVRRDLFNHYLAKFKVDESIDIDNISRQVSGFTGADISAICNEASIIAIMNNKSYIDESCIEEAIDKKVFKGNRSKKEQFLHDKTIVAYHEAGHAIASYLLNEPIARASIQSTISGVGGAVFNEDKDSLFLTKEDFINQIIICYAGRVSEEIKFNSITTGASNDITQATNLIVNYIEKYGFDSDIGMLDIDILNKLNIVNNKDIANKISKMSTELYNKCNSLLKDNYELVELLANKLLEVETLSGSEITELLK